VASKVEPLVFNGKTFRLTFPLGWGVEVTQAGVSFITPEGQRAEIGVATSREAGEIATSSGALVATGPTPTVTVRFAGSVSQSTEAAMIEALKGIEWFPDQKNRSWWKLW
jgi:hypothetical protein